MTNILKTELDKYAVDSAWQTHLVDSACQINWGLSFKHKLTTQLDKCGEVSVRQIHCEVSVNIHLGLTLWNTVRILIDKYA